MTAERNEKLALVIEDYGKRLLGFIRKRVSNEEDAQDILQDVFYQFVGNTEPIEQLTAWLFTVTRNKIIDRQRKQRPVSLDSLFSTDEDGTPAAWAELLFDDSNNPETDFLKNVFWEALHDALAELPAEQRDVFEKHELQGLSFKQIAADTGQGVNTLISRKRYAVLHLRKRLNSIYDELINY